MWSFAAVLFLLSVVRFFALRAKKRTTDKMGSSRANAGFVVPFDRLTIPHSRTAKRRLNMQLRKSYYWEKK